MHIRSCSNAEAIYTCKGNFVAACTPWNLTYPSMKSALAVGGLELPLKQPCRIVSSNSTGNIALTIPP